ncbi:MAG: DUF7009 family protein [Candidatus Sericytochromatia bacterium]
MKLRIEEATVQLRLTRAEIAELAAQGRLEVATPLGAGQILRYRLEAAEVPAIAVAWADGVLTVRLPRAAAAEWASSGRIGFAHEIDAGGKPLTVRVEWDFKGEQQPERKARRQEAMEEAYTGSERDGREDRLAERDEPSD